MLTVCAFPHNFVEQVTPYQFMKVNYESDDDWRQATDYLRCNPSFYRRPRYDFVMISTPTLPIFGQLLSMFTCTVNDVAYPVAFIQAYEVVNSHVRSRKDKQLGLLRVRRKGDCEFISLHSIIRGALVVSAEKESPMDAIVVDTLDTDMFLRLKRLYPDYTEPLR